MPSNYLYAEFLSNIRQVTLYASLVSSKNNETKIQLLSDKQSISLSHDGETATILLPTKIAGSAQLTIPTYCAKELSFRLQVAEAIWPLQSSTTSDNNEAPWSARTLDPRVQISCRACKNLVIESSTINTWKDLPSEYWAEMMEFWHCHKPHDDHGSHKSEDNTSKGYGASTHIVAEPGIGLVDASSFLFTEEDCRGVQVFPLYFIFVTCGAYLCSYTPINQHLARTWAQKKET
jgi:ubiquitin-protein ligase E3 D